MFSREALFGKRPSAIKQSPQPPAVPPQSNYSRPQSPSRRSIRLQYGDHEDAVMSDYRPPAQPQEPPMHPMRGQAMRLRPEKSHGGNGYAFANLVSVSPTDFPDGKEHYLMLNGQFVVTATPHLDCPRGCIGLSDPQRTWAQISLGPNEVVDVQEYDHFNETNQAYAGEISAEVGFAGRKHVDTPFDQDRLADAFVKSFENQILAPGQRIIMDFQSTPLMFVIRTVRLAHLGMEVDDQDSPLRTDPDARGILTRQTQMALFRDERTAINLKASARKPAANSILQPDFKFEDLGIGGLDAEFSTIFRKAFASRLFPPGLVQQMGIMHVRGILLYGPPGTGKTLIARRIGQMLNAREPKVINGPEVLNKYVGQSEENIRKLFADAEKEQKERGDESGLHIIIFDELDAVCKQRGGGGGATGGAGVGDSIVNQLLSKLDGVDQLNNILLIGMTNRKDMIDEALLRAGRLEVHIEISLPDEHGRVQILNIHTADMRKNKLLDPSVNIDEIARMTKNFSGAEISGLVRAAGSFAFSRNTRIGNAVQVNKDLSDFKVTRDDFMAALEETTPLFGVAEEELNECLEGGIMHFSPTIEAILASGRQTIVAVEHGIRIRMLNTIISGPPGSGKTALAAKLAIDSGFPFIKLVTAQNMVGFGEAAKISQLEKIFRDADKSRLSVVVVDSIELLVDWNPIGPRFSNNVLSALKALLSRKPPKERRRVVFATTSEHSVLRQLQLLQFFDGQIPVPNVDAEQELLFVLRETGPFDETGAHEVVKELSEGLEATGKRGIGVGIKKILTAIRKASVSRKDVAGSFLEQMNQAIAERDD